MIKSILLSKSCAYFLGSVYIMRRKKIKFYLVSKLPHIMLLVMLFVVSFLVGIYLPLKIPLHWDVLGVADRIGSKYELILLLPCAATIVLAVGVFTESRFILPSQKLRGLMTFMQFLFLVLFFVVQVRNLLRAANIWMPIERLMTIPALLLYIYVANMLYDAEYMSLFGIKTKWTLNNRSVWMNTNRLASRLFSFSAILMLIPIFFYKLFYIFLAVPPISTFIIATIYSIVSSKGGSGDGGDGDGGGGGSGGSAGGGDRSAEGGDGGSDDGNGGNDTP